MKKKVLYVITKSGWGGAQRYVFDLATNLPTEDFDVAVAFGGTGGFGEPAGRLAELLVAKNIRTIFVPELGRDVSFKNDWQALGALRKLLKAERPNVVHLNSSKVGGIGALAARLEGIKKIIFTAHGWPFWEERNFLARTTILVLSWMTVILSHKTICISEYDKKHIRFLPFTRKKTVVIHNGISLVDFLSREDARDALFSKEVQESHADDLWLATSAELHPNKNLIASLEAVMRHNNRRPQKIFYVLIGEGEMRKKLEYYILEKNLKNQVVLAGFVADSQRYLQAFDMFLLPSKKEGLPYVILEAGQAALPVVASNVGGIPEIIDNQTSGLLVSLQDKEGFARALDTLAAQKPLREKMGKALQKKVLKEFSLAQMLEKTVDIYSEK